MKRLYRYLSVGLTLVMLLTGTFSASATSYQPVDDVQPAPVEDFVDVPECIDSDSVTKFQSNFAASSSNISTQAVAGQKTLRNLLATALIPCGQTLYIWGGGWSSQTASAGSDAVTIGPGANWKSYFVANAGNYDYNDHRYENRNGLDCSGFVGWTIYNTMESQSGKTGYVLSSTNMASNFANRGWGTYVKNSNITSYLPGDIVSMNGHVWISLGQCSDGSVVLIHSTPNAGVQISGTVASDGTANSQAYQLAAAAMKEYFPYWSKYYSAKACGSSYLTGNLMRWNITSGALADPDGIRNMSPEQILQILLGNRPVHASYIDVENTWYTSAIDTMLESGLMVGTGVGTFSPASITTRAQIVQVLYNMTDDHTPGTMSSVFKDVSNKSWYGSAVKWAASNGIVAGCGNYLFKPNATLTREQMVTILYQYYCAYHSNTAADPDLALKNFTDCEKISSWATDAFAWAVTNKVIVGTTTSTLSPKGTSTRAQLAQVLANYIGE